MKTQSQGRAAVWMWCELCGGGSLSHQCCKTLVSRPYDPDKCLSLTSQALRSYWQSRCARKHNLSWSRTNSRICHCDQSELHCFPLSWQCFCMRLQCLLPSHSIPPPSSCSLSGSLCPAPGHRGMVVHESLVCPEQLNCPLFFRKILQVPQILCFFSHFCVFEPFPTMTVLFWDPSFHTEDNWRTHTIITEGSNTHCCSRRKNDPLREFIKLEN